MATASDLADWWEKNRKVSEKALEDFVDENPKLWVIAALTQTAMDVGAMTVDLLRFGEGAAETYETGRIAPLVQDVFRGISIAVPLARASQAARPVLGKIMGLYADPGGGICVPIAIGNALRRTGQRFLVSLDEIAQASGLKGISSVSSMTMTESVNALRKLGAKFDTIAQVSKFDDLANAARQGDGVVMFRLMGSKGGGAHRVLLEKFGTGVRIVDRTGFYNNLAELSRRYSGVLGGGTFVVNPSGGAIFIRQVTARLLNGIPTLMMYANAIVELSENLTVPELDAKFQTFKAQQAKTSPADVGARTITVVRGDTLSGLAKAHYGAFEYWPLLWDANRSTIGDNPNLIRAGMKLNVPPFNSFSKAQLDDARRRHPTWKNY
jgi:hypothetical protein